MELNTGKRVEFLDLCLLVAFFVRKLYRNEDGQIDDRDIQRRFAVCMHGKITI